MRHTVFLPCISRSGATECFDLKDITPVGCCGNKNREVDSPGKLDNIEQGKASLIESETFKTFYLENMSSLEKRYNELTLPPLLGGSHDNFSAPSPSRCWCISLARGALLWDPGLRSHSGDWAQVQCLLCPLQPRLHFLLVISAESSMMFFTHSRIQFRTTCWT